MTRVGIIGCGSISPFHYEGYEKAGSVIAHVCDLRREVAQGVASRYNARCSTDYQQLLSDPHVDLVSVLAPASLHKQICIDAMDAGKGVVCEKTLTDNPADSYRIVMHAHQTGMFCATAFMKRYFPAAQKARQLLSQMGRIVSIHARTWQPYADLSNPKLASIYTNHPSPVVRNYGGGVLVCGGSHILDLIHWFGGRPTHVCGLMNSRPELDFDVHSSALLSLPGGSVAHLEAYWHPFTHVGYERNGWDERLEINTEKGRLDFYTVLWNHPENNGALLVHQDALTGETTEYRYPAVNPFHLEMAEMVRKFELGEPADPSAYDGYVVDELIDHITRSAESGQRLAISWRG